MIQVFGCTLIPYQIEIIAIKIERLILHYNALTRKIQRKFQHDHYS